MSFLLLGDDDAVVGLGNRGSDHIENTANISSRLVGHKAD
jgi:hypothetical protein